MADLSTIRTNINAVDEKLKPLLSERMDLAGLVAASKQASSQAEGVQPTVFVKVREEEILSAVDAGEHTEAIRHLMREIMGTSRRYQYMLLLKSGALQDVFEPYEPGMICHLRLCDAGGLTESLRIVSRYAVRVHEAHGEELVLSAKDAGELTTLRMQLYREGYILP